MSPNLLSKIEQWMRESNLLSEKTLKTFIEILKGIKKGNTIYPGLIMRRINLSTEKAYSIFELLKDKGIIKENYELYCHNCDKYYFESYEYFGDIPETVECEGCFDKMTRAANVIVIYKVIEDGE